MRRTMLLHLATLLAIGSFKGDRIAPLMGASGRVTIGRVGDRAPELTNVQSLTPDDYPIIFLRPAYYQVWSMMQDDGRLQGDTQGGSNDMEWTYDDKGSGAWTDITVWTPKNQATSNFNFKPLGSMV